LVEFFRDSLENFDKMRVIIDEGASARFVAETHRQLTAEESFPRQLTAAGFFIPRQLTFEGTFRLLHVFFNRIKHVNNNFRKSIQVTRKHSNLP